MVRTLVIGVALVSAVVVASAFLKPSITSFGDQSSAPASNADPIVVELFTSEGCSSCPPADKLLTDLDKQSAFAGVPVIAMGEHVDYWDGLGWKDRFSSATFTSRQREFGSRFSLDSIYTPQMVVDGRVELIGNDEAALRRALEKQAHLAKPVKVELKWDPTGKLHVSAKDAGTHDAQVLLAVTETNLTTTVQRGENGGRVLHHAAVVRRIERLGKLTQSKYEGLTPIATDRDWKPENLKAVVLVQEIGSGTVLGARAVAFPHN